MEVIKRINARLAWVKVDDTTAKLMTFDKDRTAKEMIEEGKKVKQKKDRLKEVRAEIKRLKG
jgi:hypothetical protein